MNIGLLQQADLLVECLEPGLDNLGDRRLRFALSAELVGQNFFFTCHHLRVETARIDGLRTGCGNMHRNLTAKRSEFVLLSWRFQRHDHAPLAETFRHRIVYIAADRARRDRDLSGATQRHVLPDGGDRRIDGIVDGEVTDLAGLDCFHSGADIEGHIGDHAHKALELLVAGDKVGFRIDFDDDALEATDRNADQAFRGDAPGLLGGLGKPFLAQPVNRSFHVAVGLTERGFAVHHARAGLVAELLNHLSAYVRHSGDPVCQHRCTSPRLRREVGSCALVAQIPVRGLLGDSGLWSGPSPRPSPRERETEKVYSAPSSLAWAIQPSTRPGKPTSSPTLWAAVALK